MSTSNTKPPMPTAIIIVLSNDTDEVSLAVGDVETLLQVPFVLDTR